MAVFRITRCEVLTKTVTVPTTADREYLIPYIEKNIALMEHHTNVLKDELKLVRNYYNGL